MLIRETHPGLDEALKSAHRQNADQIRSLSRIDGVTRISFTKGKDNDPKTK